MIVNKIATIFCCIGTIVMSVKGDISGAILCGAFTILNFVASFKEW